LPRFARQREGGLRCKFLVKFGIAPKPTITVGPFALIERIGRGGMAEVWRGHHIAQQVPVAVKVITKAAARDPLFLRIVRNEVQAAARLDHPGIVMVLDYGELTEDAERASYGQLAAGSPYIAMELASWGSLDRLKRALEWTELSRILLGVLDALAHAHARGVLHRDLKPANLLVSTEDDVRPGIKLSDFGIAHALEQEGDKRYESIPGGTPLFMAPEQFVGEWRDYGPWTDLYAVGCLAHWFATGRPLFTADNTIAIGVQHIRNAPPPLVPEHPMPAAFESWMLRLLAKDPADRFQRAADAAWALARIKEDEFATDGPTVKQENLPPVESPITTLPFATEPSFSDVTHSDDIYSGRPAKALMKREIPPLPFSWRSPPRAPAPPKLLGAGLGLYGIRRVPLVARETERDLLWSRLSTVRDRNRAEVVFVQGAAGTGKSRLVEWICERADEVGGAIVMKAFFGPMRNPSEAIAQMLARFMRVEDLDRDNVHQRVERTLRRQGVRDPYEWNALTDMLVRSDALHDTGKSSNVEFSTQRERHNLVQLFLARTSRERPVIVWFDDVQFGADALIYTRELLQMREKLDCRVLVLMTLRDDIMVDRKLEAELVEEMAQSPGCSRIELPSLSFGDQQTLVHELLGLQHSLAAEIALRTAGNPLFAVQLVDDWVQRGVLELDDSGFKLKDGESADLPEDVRDVWLRRIEDLIVDEPAEAIVALELAAVLGGEIDLEEWADACARSGISIPPALLPSLVEMRLVYRTAGSRERWSFAHNMLRESLEEHARERRRFDAHHRVSAEMLAARHGLDRSGLSGRIGKHFLQGRSYSEALLPLYWAATERWHASDYAQAQRLLDDYEKTLASLAAGNKDPRWADCWVLRARISSMQGRYKDATSWSERARDHARYFKLDAPLAGALRERAMIVHALGDPRTARSLLEEAEVLASKEFDSACLALTHLAIAEVLFGRGDLDGAQRRYFASCDALRGHGDWIGVLAALHGLGKVALWKNDREGARRFFQEEMELAEQHGNRHAYARAKASIADLLRLRGNLGHAERTYREAVEILKAIGSSDEATVRVSLGLLFLEAGDHAGARRELLVVRQMADGIEEARKRCLIHAALAADASGLGRWNDYQEHMKVVRELIEKTDAADGDVAKTLDLAADLAYRARRVSESEEAAQLARRMWTSLRRRNPSSP
jgi:eukaryotic-like serine/threonine-protein kinase